MLMLLVWELNFKSLVTEMHKKKKRRKTCLSWFQCNLASNESLE